MKVLPKPEAVATVSVTGLSEAAAVQAMSAALTSPYDVTGAARLPEGETLIRIEGFDKSVAYRAEQLQAILGRFGAVAVENDPAAVDETWRSVRDVAAFHGATGDVWRISCKPSEGPELAAKLGADAVQFDWGGGLVWALVPDGADVRSKLGAFGGHATIVKASDATIERLGRFQPESTGVAALSKALRQKYDPRGILNAGLMG